MPDIERAWHIDKRVSAGHLLTTLIIAVSAFMFIQKQEVRIGLLEQRLEIEIERSERADTEAERRLEAYRLESKTERKEMQADIRAQLDKINGKLDKLVENKLDAGIR